MARASSIDITDVENAVSQLRQRKEDITAYKVRQILGQGSYKKIEEYLLIIQGQAIHEDPENLSKYLTRLLQPVAQQLLDDVSKPFDDERDRLQQQIKVLTHDLREAKRGISNRDIALGDLQKRLDTLVAQSKKEIKDLEKENKQLLINSTKLAEESSRYQAQLKELQKIHDDSIKQHNKDTQSLNRSHKAHVADLQKIVNKQGRDLDKKDREILKLKSPAKRKSSSTKKVNTNTAKKKRM